MTDASDVAKSGTAVVALSPVETVKNFITLSSSPTIFHLRTEPRGSPLQSMQPNVEHRALDAEPRRGFTLGRTVEEHEQEVALGCGYGQHERNEQLGSRAHTGHGRRRFTRTFP